MLVNSPSDFEFLEIGLASPDRIRFWSYGEVEKPETINYRTFKPERKGLFCEKIFGPVKDWECSCGKYRRVRYRGIVCERCGVEVTHSKVRRDRMGHIELAADVAHIWFLKGIPSYLSIVLDMSTREVEGVVYYDSYIITQVSSELEDKFSVGDLLSNTDYQKLKLEYGDKFKAGSGAGALKQVLSGYDLKLMCSELRNEIETSKGQKRLKVTRRLRVLEALGKSRNRPEWMILEVIPVMPPDLRPMVQLEGGRFATSDLNDLYRRTINRNNRLRRLMDIGAPEMIIRNEKRMLQESVDVLISNGKRGRAVTGSNGRPLKSLGNIIEGKQGRFRQNLLGKRVDYSGRSVIVVGPHLKFYQCGLPKEMALELFKPFVIRKLVGDGHVTNVKSAKRKIEKREVVVWDVLEDVIKGQPVLLNRAPTLHRLGIQAFEPILVEGSAIQIHPLVCTAFNADFDGDQMAVHIPLSLEAQTECWLLILSPNNILSPSSGRPIITPTQDMVLGIYFLTFANSESKLGAGKYFSNSDQALLAWESEAVGIQSIINVRVKGRWYATTVGRLIFNAAIEKVLFRDFHHDQEQTVIFINDIVGKKQLAELIFKWYHIYGSFITAKLADEIKSIGFKYSTLSGISISIDDLSIPVRKAEILKKAETEIRKLEKLEDSENISNSEKRLRSNEIWREATHQVSHELERNLGKLNNVYIMANSGARGNIDQVRQLAGMRGLMSDAQGRTVEIPIKSNFKEGLSITEYFISSYGARKGLVDTALRTADSGYLTRRLVDVAQDVIIVQEDCGSDDFSQVEALKEGIEEVVSLSELIEGRISGEDICSLDNKEKLISKGDLISVEDAHRIEASGIKSVKIRSIYKCKIERGLCRKCYGMDLATGKLINLGEAVGIIAAQSIGEPGTQLTMRTFHTGGVDLRKAAKIQTKATESGVVKFIEPFPLSRILLEDNTPAWILSEDGSLELKVDKEKKIYRLSKGAILYVKDNAKIKSGDLLAEYDPSYTYVFSSSEGIVKLKRIQSEEIEKTKRSRVERSSIQKNFEIHIYDTTQTKKITASKKYVSYLKEEERLRIGDEIAPGQTLKEGGYILKIQEEGNNKKESKSNKEKEKVQITFCNGESYPVMAGALILVKDGDKVRKGEVLTRERTEGLEMSRTKDIVQGLPRVEELFEARRPKDSAILAHINGIVEIYEENGHRVVRIFSVESGETRDYKIPHDVRILVHSGEKVEKGDLIAEGIISPHDLMETKGVYATQSYLEQEIQKVYRSQGVQINSKHIAVIVRQMTRKINVVDGGDTRFLPNELIDMYVFDQENSKLISEQKRPALGHRVLLGITRVSLNTESFVSASSFQQTASVLTKASIEGQIDKMYGLKENVIIGRLIPAGTGFSLYNRVGLEFNPDEAIEKSQEEASVDSEKELVSSQ